MPQTGPGSRSDQNQDNRPVQRISDQNPSALIPSDSTMFGEVMICTTDSVVSRSVDRHVFWPRLWYISWHCLGWFIVNLYYFSYKFLFIAATKCSKKFPKTSKNFKKWIRRNIVFGIRDPQTARSGDWPVRIGPRFSKFCSPWSVPVRDFLNFLNLCPSLS